MPEHSRNRRRRIMRTFKINEISPVDVAAQEGAEAVIMKRRDGGAVNQLSAEDAKDLIKRGRAMLLQPKNRHTHLVVLEDFDGEETNSGVTSHNNGHSHPWIRTPDGRIVVGEENGHDHESGEMSKQVALGLLRKLERLPDEAELVGLIAKLTGTAADDIGTRDGEENDMTDTQKSADDLKAENDELQKKLEKANKLAELSDAQRGHYAKLDEDGQTAFLEMSVEARQAAVDAEVAKAADSNPVVYKAKDGSEYRKNDDPRLVSMAKQRDEDAEKIAKAEAKAEQANYEKRAEAELKDHPGNLKARVAILKGIDGVRLTEEEQKLALDATKARSDQLAKSFETLGAGGQGELGSPEQELEQMAADLAKKEGISHADAYSRVLDTPEGDALYAKHKERARPN